MNLLARVLNQEEKYSDGEAMLREILDVARRTLGPEHRKALAAMNNLGAALDGENKHAEAVLLFQELLDTQRRIHGPEH